MNAKRKSNDTIIFWDVTHSPLGWMHVAVNGEGNVRYVTYGGRSKEPPSDLCRLGEPIRDFRRVEPVIVQLREYFAGRRRHFDVSVDLGGLTRFQQDVLVATMGIPYAQVASYKQIASSTGRPTASRAVGATLGKNPIGIVIPCHRVVASDGRLGGFSGPGGIQTKEFLLDLECKAAIR